MLTRQNCAQFSGLQTGSLIPSHYYIIGARQHAVECNGHKAQLYLSRANCFTVCYMLSDNSCSHSVRVFQQLINSDC